MLNKSAVATVLPPFLIVLVTIVAGVFTVDNCTDWGDDYAQYLVQARTIASGQERMPVSCLGKYSPDIRGPLFSLILLPIVNTSFAIAAGKCIVLLFLCGSSILTFKLLFPVAGRFGATTGAMLLILNYSFFRVSSQVLPDIPFTFFTLLAFYLLTFQGKVYWYYAMISAGLAITLREAGWMFLPAFAFFAVITGYKTHSQIRHLPGFLTALMITVFVVVLSVGLLLQSWPDGWYVDATFSNFKWSVILENCTFYVHAFQTLFEYEIPGWINRIIGPALLLLTSFGWLIRLKSGPRLPEYYSAFYLLMLVIYPYHHEPARFLFPVLPMVLIYVATAVRLTGSLMSSMLPKYLPGLTFLLLLLFNLKHYPERRFAGNGPCSADAKELFAYLGKFSGTDLVFKTTKPWALSWYASVNTVPESCDEAFAQFIIEDKINQPLNLKSAPVFENIGFAVYLAH